MLTIQRDGRKPQLGPINSSTKYTLDPSTSPNPLTPLSPGHSHLSLGQLLQPPKWSSWLALYPLSKPSSQHPSETESQRQMWSCHSPAKTLSMASPYAVNESMLCSMTTRPQVIRSLSILPTGATRHLWSLITHTLLPLPQNCPEGCFSAKSPPSTPSLLLANLTHPSDLTLNFTSVRWASPS